MQYRGIIISLLVVLSLMFVGCSTDSESTVITDNSGKGLSLAGAPDRMPDLTAKINTIRGNKLTVYKMESGNQSLSDEERMAMREYMQSLSPEEREKVRAEQNQVSNELFELVIPVGTPIISTQNIGGEAVIEELNIADLREGSMVRFWIEGGLEKLDVAKEETLYVDYAQIAGAGGY